MIEAADVNEAAFIHSYCELTGCDEPHARSVYMHLTLLQLAQRMPGSPPAPEAEVERGPVNGRAGEHAGRQQ
jgi:hypothetical protein